jgi:hypothetical protein
MSFIKYSELQKKYISGRMHENIRRLQDYDIFQCLLAGGLDRVEAVKRHVSSLPEDFLNWLEICDGGMLFDTAMLSTKSYDVKLGLEFETYGDYFNASLRKDKRLLDNWFVFAIAVHSDLFFFDLTKNDGHVYQWDVEEYNIYASWASFEDWLTDQINEAIKLIANEELEPLDIKLEANSNV